MTDRVTMTTLVKFLLVLCVLVKYSQESSNDNATDSGRKLVDPLEEDVSEAPKFGKLSNKKAKPLRSIFMGLYRNYKSTYLGNKTSLEYTKSLKDVERAEPNETKAVVSIKKRAKNKKVKAKKKSKRGTVKKDDPLIYSYDNEFRYELGQGVNLTLDMNKEMVSVNLDEENIKDILLGIWKSDDDESGEGRGKKHHEMLSKILPLFILPFLIQSAIVPFIVSKLKLLLLKSIIVGKIAIFIMIISALKNSPKHMSFHDTSGSGYWGGEPSRRSEPFNPEKNGYKFETKPPVTSWDP